MKPHTHVRASDCALKARSTAPYASCSRLWIWASISLCILWYIAEPTFDLPLPTMLLVGALLYCDWGRSSSVPVLKTLEKIQNFMMHRTQGEKEEETNVPAGDTIM